MFHTFTATRIVALVLIGVMALYYLPALIIKINVCRPIAAFWSPPPLAAGADGDNAVTATCIDQVDLFVADTVLSAVTDFAVLALPIPATMSLRLPLRRRLRVWAMLGLGGVATLVSIVRMVVVIQMRGVTDQTVEFVRFNLLGYVCSAVFSSPLPPLFPSVCCRRRRLFCLPSTASPHRRQMPRLHAPPYPTTNSTAEVSIGLICACLPALNILHTKWQQLRQMSVSDGSGWTANGAATPDKSMRLRTLKFLAGSRLHTAPPLSTTIVAPPSVVTTTTVITDASRVKVKRDASCPCSRPCSHVVGGLSSV